jgi:Ion channel
MTTVGYGARYPVTGIGQLVAVGLMIGGIALLGTVTATLASWLVGTVAAEKEQAEDLDATVQRLEAKVESTRDRAETRPGPDLTTRLMKFVSASIASSANPCRRPWGVRLVNRPQGLPCGGTA